MSSNVKYLDETGLAYFWDKIKDHISDSVASGTSNLTNRIHFVVPDQKSTTATLTATVGSITALTPGLVIALRMPFANSANTTLNINELGAKPVYYQSSTRTAGLFPAGTVILLVYEETSIATGCFKAIYSYDKDTDTHYSTKLFLGSSNSSTYSNATYTTDNNSTYIVVNDKTSGGSHMGLSGVQIKGIGGTTVAAKDGVLTINSLNASDLPTYEPVSNLDIDAMINGTVFISRAMNLPGEAYDGFIKISFAWPEGGSDTGTNVCEELYVEHPQYDSMAISSNVTYPMKDSWGRGEVILSNESWQTSSFNDIGISIEMYVVPDIEELSEDGTPRFYSTIGSAVSGCENSEYTTYPASIEKAEYYKDSLEERGFWAYISAPEIGQLTTPGDSHTWYVNYVSEDQDTNGALLDESDEQETFTFGVTVTYLGIDPDEPQYGRRYKADFRWICVAQDNNG